MIITRCSDLILLKIRIKYQKNWILKKGTFYSLFNISSSFKTPQRNFQKRTLYDDGDPWGSFKGRLQRDRFDEPGRLQVPRWDELTLTPFEKNFYSEHPDVTNRTDVSSIY